MLGTAKGFDQAKTKASSIRKQRGLKFDDVLFMTSRRFYGMRTPAASTGRRIEYASLYNPSKEDASGASGTLRATFTILTSNKCTKIYLL